LDLNILTRFGDSLTFFYSLIGITPENYIERHEMWINNYKI